MSEALLFETIRKLANGQGRRSLMVSIPKYFSKELNMQRGDLVKVSFNVDKRVLYVEKLETK